MEQRGMMPVEAGIFLRQLELERAVAVLNEFSSFLNWPGKSRREKPPVYDDAQLTRQQDSGRGVTRKGREYNISYDLSLCEYCGNLEPFVVCPAKVAMIKDRLLNA